MARGGLHELKRKTAPQAFLVTDNLSSDNPVFTKGRKMTCVIEEFWDKIICSSWSKLQILINQVKNKID